MFSVTSLLSSAQLASKISFQNIVYMYFLFLSVFKGTRDY